MDSFHPNHLSYYEIFMYNLAFINTIVWKLKQLLDSCVHFAVLRPRRSVFCIVLHCNVFYWIILHCIECYYSVLYLKRFEYQRIAIQDIYIPNQIAMWMCQVAELAVLYPGYILGSDIFKCRHKNIYILICVYCKSLSWTKIKWDSEWMKISVILNMW